VDAIREVDQYHLIFIERPIWVKGGWTQADADNLYFPVGITDPGPKSNIVFEYHMYEPIQLTHQHASWTSFAGTFAVYPDPDRVVAQDEQWEWFTDGNPLAGTGTTPWTTLTGNLYQVTDTDYRLGRPVIQGRELGAGGKVYIDNIVVEEYDETGTFVRTILDTPADSIAGWSFWSADGSGTGELETGVAGASGGKCLSISGTTDDANLGNDNKFIVTHNYQYRITGDIRGSNVGSGATVRYRADFYSCTGDIHSWNKAYMDALIDSYIQFGQANNVPLYLGEFGTIIFSFEDNRGGLAWVTDLLDILKTGNVNYNYHTYHETNFGLYTNGDWELPDPDALNEPLANLFSSVQH
jgi:endoglucanase